MKLTLGAAAVVAVAFSSAAAHAQDVEHFTNIEKAVEAAKKGKKDILVDFTGSDWCGWCIKLTEEVFATEEWKKAASDKYVFVELDFPQAKKQTEEEKKYNREKQALYGIQGFPTILVLNSDGRLYARTGYEAGGPENYLKHLAGFSARKAELTKGLAAVKEGKPADRAKALAALLDKLAEWEVDGGYRDLKEQMVELDVKSDAGRKFAKELALAYHQEGAEEKFKKYLKLLKENDADGAEYVETAIAINKDVMPILESQDWKGGLEKLTPMLTKKGEAGQIVRFYAAICEVRQGNKDKAIDLLDAGAKMAPKTPLAKQMTDAILELKR